MSTDDALDALMSHLYFVTGAIKELRPVIEEETERVKAFIAAATARRERLKNLMKKRRELLQQIKEVQQQNE